MLHTLISWGLTIVREALTCGFFCWFWHNVTHHRNDHKE